MGKSDSSRSRFVPNFSLISTTEAHREKITLQHCRCSPWVTEAQEDGQGGQIDGLWRRLLDIDSSSTLGFYMNADLVTLRPSLPAARDLQLVDRSSASHYVKHVLEYDDVRDDMDKLNGQFFSRNPSKWYHKT